MGKNAKYRLRWCWRFKTIFNGGFNTKKTKNCSFFPSLQEKNATTEQHQNDRSDVQHCTKNNFYLVKNPSKLCTEGAIRNFMNVLNCPEIEVNQFWDIVQSPMHLILWTLGESSVPKAVLNPVEKLIQFKQVCGFFVNNSSSLPQVRYKLNASKTCKKQSTF